MLERLAGIAAPAVLGCLALGAGSGCAEAHAAAPLAAAAPPATPSPAAAETAAALEPLPAPGPASPPAASSAPQSAAGDGGASSSPVPADSAAAAVAGGATPAGFHVLLVDEPPFRPAFSRPSASAARAHANAKKRGRSGRPYHAASRVVVDVPDADRDPAAAALQRETRNLGYWPFRTCFEAGLRRAPDLGGTVRLHLRVGDGGVGGSDLVSSTIRDPVVAACVAREAGHLHWSSTDEARSAEIQVTLGAGDDPVFVPPPVHHAEALRQELREPWAAVERCFSDGLAKTPDAGGRMELRFRLESSGAVAEVSEGETRFPAIDVTQCVLAVYRAVSLPASGVAKRDETFVYPLQFEAVSSDVAASAERER